MVVLNPQCIQIFRLTWQVISHNRPLWDSHLFINYPCSKYNEIGCQLNPATRSSLADSLEVSCGDTSLCVQAAATPACPAQVSRYRFPGAVSLFEYCPKSVHLAGQELGWFRWRGSGTVCSPWGSPVRIHPSLSKKSATFLAPEIAWLWDSSQIF